MLEEVVHGSVTPRLVLVPCTALARYPNSGDDTRDRASLGSERSMSAVVALNRPSNNSTMDESSRPSVTLACSTDSARVRRSLVCGHMNGQPQVLRSWLWNLVGAEVFLVLAGVCAAVAVSAGPSTSVIGAVVVASVLVGAACRVLTLGVHATPKALVVREFLHTTTLRWKVVRTAELVERRPASPGRRASSTPLPKLNFVDADGRPNSMFLAALGARRSATARRNVQALNDLIRTHVTR